VRLKRDDLFVRIIIEDAQLEVIRTGNEPVLARDEAYTSNGYFRNLEGFHEGTGIGVVDVHAAIVETSEQPRFGRVKVDCFDAIGTLEEFSLRRRS
jgi:hypothetical protein